MRPDGTRNKLPRSIELPAGMCDYDVREARRVLGIMSEFVIAPDWLGRTGPGASILGSARVERGDLHYARTERIRGPLSDTGRLQT